MKKKLTIREALKNKQQLYLLLKPNVNDKLQHAINKQIALIDSAKETLQTEFDSEVDRIRIKYASVYPSDFDDKAVRGHFIYTKNKDGNNEYTFNRDNTLKVNEEINEKSKSFLEKEIEVECYQAENDWARVDEVDLFLRDELTDLLFKKEEGKKEKGTGS